MVFNIISDYYPFAPGYTKTRYTGGIHKDGNKWRQALYAVAHMNVPSHAPKSGARVSEVREAAPDRHGIDAGSKHLKEKYYYRSKERIIQITDYKIRNTESKYKTQNSGHHNEDLFSCGYP